MIIELHGTSVEVAEVKANAYGGNDYVMANGRFARTVSNDLSTSVLSMTRYGVVVWQVGISTQVPEGLHATMLAAALVSAIKGEI